MKLRHFIPFVVLALVLFTAGLAAAASRIVIAVLSDRGDPATMNEKQFAMRNQVGEWMEKDLLKLLSKAGYEARLIGKAEEFQPAAGQYLLKVAIVSYNPGSKAARMMVGYGAGATSLDTRAELVDQKGATLLTEEFGVGSSRDWHYSTRKVNEQTVAAVTNRLRQQ